MPVDPESQHAAAVTEKDPFVVKPTETQVDTPLPTVMEDAYDTIVLGFPCLADSP